MKIIYKTEGQDELILPDKVLYFKTPDKKLEFIYSETHKVTWEYDSNKDRDEELKKILLGMAGKTKGKEDNSDFVYDLM